MAKNQQIAKRKLIQWQKVFDELEVKINNVEKKLAHYINTNKYGRDSK